LEEQTIHTEVFDAHHPAYAEVWELREAVLRAPLGMSLKNEDLSRDFVDTIVIARIGSALAGCILLHRKDDHLVKFRAMAVWPHLQGKGIGSIVLAAAEDEARRQGYTMVELNARCVAEAFYLKNGYTPQGAVFEEVGIPHVYMTKKL